MLLEVLLEVLLEMPKKEEGEKKVRKTYLFAPLLRVLRSRRLPALDVFVLAQALVELGGLYGRRRA